MLCAALNFYQAFPCHVAPINLQHPNKIGLTKLTGFADFSAVFSDAKILFDLLFHKHTPTWT